MRRILYIYQGGASTLDRVRELQELGLSVHALDAFARFHSHSRPVTSLACRRFAGPAVETINKTVRDELDTQGSTELVIVDKAGAWLTEQTVHQLRTLGTPLIHFTGDCLFRANNSPLFKANLPLYDLAITTKPFELDDYLAAGARRVLLAEKSVPQRRFYPRPANLAEQCSLASGLIFVGRAERHYRNLIRRLSRAHLPISVWGPHWVKQRMLRPWTRRVVRGGGLWGEEYPEAVSAAQIGIGLLSKLFPEEVTDRSLEIPACGTMLLAERTSKHQDLFIEGREAEFFATPDELIEKARFYLAHPAARRKIAAAGHTRFLESGYSLEHQTRRLWKQICDVLS